MSKRISATALCLVVILSAGAGTTLAPPATAAEPVIRDGAVATERVTTQSRRFTSDQRHVARLVNDTRADRGKRRLTLNLTLTRKAQRWAEHLARTNSLAHSELTSGVPGNWRALGENVGYASTSVGVHQAFMRSAPHRHNILGQWNAIGTGQATSNGRVFVVHVFMRT